jgi:hypothetical protein
VPHPGSLRVGLVTWDDRELKSRSICTSLEILSSDIYEQFSGLAHTRSRRDKLCSSRLWVGLVGSDRRQGHAEGGVLQDPIVVNDTRRVPDPGFLRVGLVTWDHADLNPEAFVLH